MAKAGSMRSFMVEGYKKFVRDEDGATAIEYGLIVAGVALALIPFLPNLNNFYKHWTNEVTDTMNNMMP